MITGGCRSRTTHLVFSSVVRPGCRNAQSRAGLGANSIDSLEARGIVRRGEVVWVCARTASEGVADRHVGFLVGLPLCISLVPRD